MVKGSSIGLGLQSMLRGFEVEANVTMKSDAGAAVAISCRIGLGKFRHKEVRSGTEKSM